MFLHLKPTYIRQQSLRLSRHTNHTVIFSISIIETVKSSQLKLEVPR